MTHQTRMRFEKIWVPINGVSQGMFIQCQDPTRPVLLFLHGGPGMPEFYLTQWHPTGLEDLFTICWWDQRGAGLSYHPDIPPATMTVEQLIADTLAVADFLRQRFHQDKVYLMAHSGGSFFGIQAAARSPERFHAYIGMGQMTYQLKSEMLAYDHMLELCRQAGKSSLLRKLKAAPRPTLTGTLPPAYDAIRDDVMHALGVGTTRQMDSIITGVFWPSWFCQAYTLKETINLWRGKLYSRRCLRDTMFATDLSGQITRLALPAYFFHGRYDYTCAHSLAREFADTLTAPRKAFYTFENSAHSPFFEEPEKVRQIFREDIISYLHSTLSLI